MIMDRCLNKHLCWFKKFERNCTLRTHEKNPRAMSFFLAVLYFRAWGSLLTSHEAGILLH